MPRQAPTILSVTRAADSLLVTPASPVSHKGRRAATAPSFTSHYSFCGASFWPRLLRFLFTVVLPFVLLILWQNMVIPQQFYRLELRRAQAVSNSQMDRSMLRAYFAWEVVNLFLGAILSSSLMSQVAVLLRNPESWILVLGASFPQSANFFMNYVALRAGMMNMFRQVGAR